MVLPLDKKKNTPGVRVVKAEKKTPRALNDIDRLLKKLGK